MFNVCVVNSNYSLLLYLVTLKKNKKTLFFFSGGVSDEISDNIKYKIKLPEIRQGRLISLIYLSIYYVLTFFFIKPIFYILKVKTFGHDHLYFSNILGKDYTLIEDGLGNYITRGPNRNKYIALLSLIKEPLGYDSKCKKCILTNMHAIPFDLKEKVFIVNLKNCWIRLTDSERNNILEIFNMKNYIMSDFSEYSILLTQPLYQDGYIPKKLQNEIYQKVIDDYKLEKIIVKKHPRDKYDYKFTIDIKEINSSIPLELFSMLNFEFKSAYSYYSTSIKTVHAKEIVLLGTDYLLTINKEIPKIKREVIVDAYKR